jgi:hypothetical protein
MPGAGNGWALARNIILDNSHCLTAESTDSSFSLFLVPESVQDPFPART